ncbi:MAG: tetratricopeptide repeat protein [Flavobacteriia bacterium]|nr:tetratricopeptide repeat protein [Flavobacteriia bacterium]
MIKCFNHIKKYFVLICFLNVLMGVAGQSVYEKKIIEEYKKENNPQKRFWNLYKIAKYYNEKNYIKADSIRESLLVLSYSANDSAKYLAQIYDAERDLINGNKEVYFSKILSLQSFNAKIPNKEIKLDLYQRMGDYHLYLRELDQAKIYLSECEKISKKIRNNREISETYRLLSQVHMLKNDKDSCYYFVDLALQFSRRSGENIVKSDALFNQGTAFAYFGQIELSVSKNLNALEFANQASDNERIARISLKIGESELLIKNYADASFYFNNALLSATYIQNKRIIALSQLFLGVLEKEKKNYLKAIEYMRKSLRSLQTFNDNDGLGEVHNALGDVYRERKEFIMALRYYNKALVLFESTGNREKSATVYHNVGTVFEKQGKYKNALNYLNRSAEIRSQFGFKGIIFDTYKTISEVYLKLGNIPKAYKFLKLYMIYSDSAKTLESTTKIAELSELYRSEERQKLITLQADSLERQNQEKALTSAKIENIQLKTNLQTYIIIGFVLFMILAGIIGFYRWNQTKIKQQQQQAEMKQTLLRAQMNPHFVFNAMSVIQSYIFDNDTQNSAKFLLNFSKLMRLILENSSKEEIPIQIEYDILDKYLHVQKMRFEERFEYHIEVDEQLVEEEASIPPMITQPFIENAIEHGRLHLKEDGFIRIKFKKNKNMLQISVEDNGIGRKGAEMNKKSKDHKSMAMKITKDRIDNLNKKYRSDGFLKIEDFDKKAQTGTKILISIPYRVVNQN